MPTYILNEDTQPVIRAIGVSHTVAKMSFDKTFDLTAGVYFNFHDIYELHHMCRMCITSFQVLCAECVACAI